MSATVGMPVTLQCDLYGYVPSMQVLWFREDSSEIQNGGKYSIAVSTGDHMVQTGETMPRPSILSTLVINQLSLDDGGIYRCGTSESDGSEIILKIVEPPQPRAPSGKSSYNIHM